MVALLAERQTMGRPKRDEAMANVKITQKAYDLAKEAAKLGDQGKKLTIVDFVSQAVIQVAQEKFEAEEQRLRALREGPPKQKETKDGPR